MHTVEFKGYDNDDYSLITVDPGRRQRAEEQIDSYSIPYRDDDLIIHSGKYQPYLREMIFAYSDKTKTKSIYNWLTGRGVLKTSVDTDGYFIASVVSALQVAKQYNSHDSIRVSFKVNPFFYLNSGLTVIEYTTSPQTLANPGTVASEPYIKITGTGNITLTINAVNHVFTAVDGYIEIDSELKLVYKGTTNEGSKMTGEFPVLAVGNNAISWTGTVTKVEITPRWREL